MPRILTIPSAPVRVADEPTFALWSRLAARHLTMQPATTGGSNAADT